MITDAAESTVVCYFTTKFKYSGTEGLTLANNCSISTDMVSNILSWVELFSSGVVSDLEEKE